LLGRLQALKLDAHAAWLAARDPRTPWQARAVGLLVTAYALSPIDLIPDFIPVLGLLDDAILVPLGLWLFIRLIPPALWEEHKAAALAASGKPRSKAGAVIVSLVWAAAALLAARWMGLI
jgi:uncharacterized membrane protein YkvA (DUF1232 family)